MKDFNPKNNSATRHIAHPVELIQKLSDINPDNLLVSNHAALRFLERVLKKPLPYSLLDQREATVFIKETLLENPTKLLAIPVQNKNNQIIVPVGYKNLRYACVLVLDEISNQDRFVVATVYKNHEDMQNDIDSLTDKLAEYEDYIKGLQQTIVAFVEEKTNTNTANRLMEYMRIFDESNTRFKQVLSGALSDLKTAYVNELLRKGNTSKRQLDFLKTSIQKIRPTWQPEELLNNAEYLEKLNKLKPRQLAHRVQEEENNLFEGD